MWRHSTTGRVGFWETGHLDRALRDLSDAIRIGDTAVPLLNRGAIMEKLGRDSDALVDYSAAIHMEPANPSAHRSRAHVFHRMGRFSEAVADYDVAIQVDPKFQRTWQDREKALTQTQLD